MTLSRLLAVLLAIWLGGASQAVAQVTAGDDAPLRFGRFLHNGKVHYGFLAAGGIHVLDRSFLEQGATLTGQVLDVDKVTILAPVQPATVIGIARNYKSHGGKRGGDVKFFAKLPGAVIGTGEQIVAPPGSKELHYEGEMVIVMGRLARNVRARDAGDYVFGVTIGNDVTERGFGSSAFDLLRAKAADTLAPMGPWIVPGLYYDNLKLVTKLNGKIVQKASTRQMIHNVGQIIEAVTKYITLRPGDVIFTGTPGSTGPLKAGDTIEIRLEGVGILKNTVATR